MHRHDTPPTSETGPNGGFMALDVVFLVNKTHLSRGFRLHDGGVDQAGAGGGARSRAMRANICPNIRPDTATSANWKVT